MDNNNHTIGHDNDDNRSENSYPNPGHQYGGDNNSGYYHDNANNPNPGHQYSNDNSGGYYYNNANNPYYPYPHPYYGGDGSNYANSYYEINNRYSANVAQNNGKGLATASMVMGILGLVFFGWGIVYGTLAIVFAVISKKKGFVGGTATAGLVMGIIGLAFSVLFMIICIPLIIAAYAEMPYVMAEFAELMEYLQYYSL